MSKRALSDSDCDDIFSDHKSSCLTPPESCGHQGVTRKKRRGIIEKRRRDRINNSLTELRRLVPTAFEKQGSAKLEKAEILQMTVDHLKMIHAKGFDAFAYDPQKYLMDYHTVGFRECIRETTVYLQSEGMDGHDPLCQRLMSHLHGALTQRELANKQAAASSWTLATPNYALPHHNLNTNTGPPPQQPSLMEPPEQYMTTNTSNIHMEHHHQPLQRYHQLNHPITSSPQDRNSAGGYGGLTPYAFPNQNTTNNPSTIYVPNGKPYRPWGAELAY